MTRRATRTAQTARGGAARLAVAGAAATLWPAGAALACPVCWGDADSPLAAAMNSGVYVLLGVTLVVLGWFAVLILTIRNRAKRWEARKSALHVVSFGRRADLTRNS